MELNTDYAAGHSRDQAKMKKPSKCASVRGMEGVLSLVVKTFFLNDPIAVLMLCKTGTVDAKMRQFLDLPKSEAIFFVSVPGYEKSNNSYL